MFWRKGDVLADMVEEYLKKAEECLTLFKEAFENCFSEGLSGDFNNFVEKTHMAESTCDDLRRHIEAAMYEQSLIPESRGDILGLLEALDKVPNRAEGVLFMVQCQQLNIPKKFHLELRQLVLVNVETFTDLSNAVRAVFRDIKTVRPLLSDIDKRESASDDLERKLITDLFADPGLETGEKILLKELVLEIGNVSDHCENVGDRIAIIILKRMV